jgi:hypothetical protein
MTWGQFLKLLFDNNLFALVIAIFTVATWQEKYEALLNLLNAIKPIIGKLLDGGTISSMSAADTEALEQRALNEMAAADHQLSTLAIGDRLKRLKDIYDFLAPFLRLIGVPAPPLPFGATTG